MPFGMQTAPATFQKMMSDAVLRGFEFVDANKDDVEVDTPTSFPQHLLELRLGMVGYERKFIPNFSERAAVLTDLTRGKNRTKVKWLDVYEQAF